MQTPFALSSFCRSRDLATLERANTRRDLRSARRISTQPHFILISSFVFFLYIFVHIYIYIYLIYIFYLYIFIYSGRAPRRRRDAAITQWNSLATGMERVKRELQIAQRGEALSRGGRFVPRDNRVRRDAVVVTAASRRTYLLVKYILPS